MNGSPERPAKNKKGKRLGNFLRTIKEVAPALLKAVGLDDFGTAIGLINSGKSGLNEKEQEEFFRLYELDYQDLKNARELQKEALKQSDVFSKRFIYYLATFWSVIGASYIFCITFFEVVNERVSDTILGFLIGTIVSSIISYFFGSSKGSKDKDKFLN